MSIPMPNFFILGAPKCGTTSIVSWLSMHDNVYIPRLKEPNYFNKDSPTVARLTQREYECLFRGTTARHVALGEATTGYLRSRIAIPAILQSIADPRFIVCIRNPIEMAVSLHSERLKAGHETERDFGTAWRLQALRESGQRVPPLCLAKEDLLYGPICRLGEQLERVRKLVTPERLLVVVLDDIRADPGDQYRRILRFLDVPDDGRTDFPIQNRAIYLSPVLAAPLRFAALMKKRLRIRGRTGLISLTRRAFGRPSAKCTLSIELRHEMAEYFRPQVDKLRGLLDRDFSPWLE